MMGVEEVPRQYRHSHLVQKIWDLLMVLDQVLEED